MNSFQSTNVYLVGGSRTAFAGLLGGLKEASAPEMAASTIRSLLHKTQMDPASIEAAYFGQVIQAGSGQSPARQAAILGGLPESTQACTINKVCGSGLESINIIAQGISAGRWETGIAGGMESMSQAPHLSHQLRGGFKYGTAALIDAIEKDGLSDAYSSQSMGSCAEICNQKLQISRKDQDDYAILSYQRALAAQEKGIFQSQITDVTLKNGKHLECTQDENLSKVKFDKIPTLKPAFTKDPSGSITAANASSLNDGAASLLLTKNLSKISQQKSIFRIKSIATHAQNPTWFVTAPVAAMNKALTLANLQLKDIGVFEINEAFALVVLSCARELKLPLEVVNIFGGAISLGHPIGTSGTRIVLSLMNAMEEKSVNLGMASICIGGGEGLAIILERVK